MESGLKYQVTVTMITEQCCNCGVYFGLPSDLRQVLKNHPDQSFYCPNGHAMHYKRSETQIKLDKQLRDNERLHQQLLEQQATNAQLEGIIKKKDREHKRLVKNGVCPCCTRSFTNLKRHMENKHPEYLKDV